jgi:hypothetical protein
LLAATEAIVYEHMLGEEVAQMIFSLCYSENKVAHKNFLLYWIAKRASGDMQTAFGNWLVNRLVQLHILWKLGHRDFFNTCEGDDCISSSNFGLFPSSEDYARYGFNAKTFIHPDLYRHSFCGAVYSPDGDALTDPLKVLLKIGWTDPRYRNASEKIKNRLLVSKALSYGYQYPYCPVVRPIVEWIFRVLPNTIPKFDDVYGKSDPRLSYLSEDPSIVDFQRQFPLRSLEQGRHVVEEVFNVLEEHQVIIEKYFNSKSDLLPFSFPFLDIPADWLDFWARNASDDDKVVNFDHYPEDLEFCKFVNKAGSKPGTIVVTDWTTLSYEEVVAPETEPNPLEDDLDEFMYAYGAKLYAYDPATYGGRRRRRAHGERPSRLDGRRQRCEGSFFGWSSLNCDLRE